MVSAAVFRSNGPGPSTNQSVLFRHPTNANSRAWQHSLRSRSTCRYQIGGGCCTSRQNSGLLNVVRNKGAPGVDGQTVEDASGMLRRDARISTVLVCRTALRSHEPVAGVEPRGEFRTAHRAEEALLQRRRPVDICRPLSTVSGYPSCPGGRQAETVIRWHRAGFRAYWRWRSRPRRGRLKAPLESRLIRDMSLANPLWGAPRIHGELLGQTSVANGMDRPCSRP